MATAIAAAFAASAPTVVAAGASVAAGTAAGAAAAAAGSIGLAAGGGFTIGGVSAAGAGAAGGFGLLQGLQVFGAIQGLISPIFQGIEAAEAGDIQAEQFEFDRRQALLQGRESSLRALTRLNEAQAANITAGFASGIGLSPSVARSSEALGRQFVFEDVLTRSTATIRAEQLGRGAKQARRQGRRTRGRGFVQGLKNLERSATLFQKF